MDQLFFLGKKQNNQAEICTTIFPTSFYVKRNKHSSFLHDMVVCERFFFCNFWRIIIWRGWGIKCFRGIWTLILLQIIRIDGNFLGRGTSESSCVFHCWVSLLNHPWYYHHSLCAQTSYKNLCFHLNNMPSFWLLASHLSPSPMTSQRKGSLSAMADGEVAWGGPMVSWDYVSQFLQQLLAHNIWARGRNMVFWKFAYFFFKCVDL